MSRAESETALRALANGMEIDKDFQLQSVDSATKTIDTALAVLDGFIGEREVYEPLPPYLVGRATAADVLLREVRKELEQERQRLSA